jgi:hypothetical protein
MASKNAPNPAAGLLVPGKTRALAAIKRIKDELAALEKTVRSSKEAPSRAGTGVQVQIHPEPKRHPGRKAQAAGS